MAGGRPDPSRLFDLLDMADGKPFVVGVSGGSDSIALLHLFDLHCRARASAARPVAVTVDHALRPESAREAAHVAAQCAARGIRHRTVRWDGDKPAQGISAAARTARHRLLSEAAEAEGARAVLVAHTANDQAETVAMRAARGTGPGEAGIAPATLFENRIWFIRPLLTTGRAALRELLRAEGTGWIDDPTNADTRYERARTRLKIASAADPEGLVGQLTERAAAAGRGRTARSRAVADAMRRHVAMVAPGLFRIDPALFDAGPEGVPTDLLRIVAAIAGGRTHLPDLERSRALAGRLGEGPLRATLARALVDRRRTGVFVLREARGLPATDGPVGGDPWDGRFRATRRDGTVFREVAPSAPGAGGDAAPAQLLRAAAAAERPGMERVMTPWAQFLPLFDMDAATAFARMAGLAVPPAPPLRGHNEAGA